jgi:hypothetical protein
MPAKSEPRFPKHAHAAEDHPPLQVALPLEHHQELHQNCHAPYPAYAGYTGSPEWLTRDNLWLRVARAGEDAAAAYRKQIEDYLTMALT